MNLVQLQDLMKKLRKDRNTKMIPVLSTIIGEVQNKGTQPLAVINKMVQSNITVLDAIKGDSSKAEMQEKLETENEFLNGLLPVQLTKEQIQSIVAEQKIVDMPSAHKYFRANHNGQYDGAVLTEVVKAL